MSIGALAYPGVGHEKVDGPQGFLARSRGPVHGFRIRNVARQRPSLPTTGLDLLLHGLESVLTACRQPHGVPLPGQA